MNSTQNAPIQSQNHYKPGPDLFIADLLSRQNHNKYAEILGMEPNINAIQTTTNIPDCMTIQELQQATSQDEHLQLHQEHIRGRPEYRDQIPHSMRGYWTFYDDMIVIDWVILKGRHVGIPEVLQRQALEQLHINHVGMKTKPLVHE